jgi:hypothetical protein
LDSFGILFGILVFGDSLDADESAGFLFVCGGDAADPPFSSASGLLDMQVRIGVIPVDGIAQLRLNRLGDTGFQILSNQRGRCVSKALLMQSQHRGGVDFQSGRHPGMVAVCVDTLDNTADQVDSRYQTGVAPFSHPRVKIDVDDELRIFGTDGDAVGAQTVQLVVAACSEVEIADSVFG